MATAVVVQGEVEMTGLEKAQAYDARMRDLEKQIQSTWHECGEVGLWMRNSKGWEMLGHHSFNAWLLDAAPRSRSVVYAAINALEELTEIPAEELKEIAHSTVHVLKKLPKDVRSKPEVRKAAKEMTTKEFTRKVKRENPNLHLEEFEKREFRLTESQEDVIDRALAKAGEIYDLPTDELRLEAVCADFLLTENGG